jgi:hypothetical protein
MRARVRLLEPEAPAGDVRVAETIWKVPHCTPGVEQEAVVDVMAVAVAVESMTVEEESTVVVNSVTAWVLVATAVDVRVVVSGRALVT